MSFVQQYCACTDARLETTIQPTGKLNVCNFISRRYINIFQFIFLIMCQLRFYPASVFARDAVRYRFQKVPHACKMSPRINRVRRQIEGATMTTTRRSRVYPNLKLILRPGGGMIVLYFMNELPPLSTNRPGIKGLYIYTRTTLTRRQQEKKKEKITSRKSFDCIYAYNETTIQ